MGCEKLKIAGKRMQNEVPIQQEQVSSAFKYQRRAATQAVHSTYEVESSWHVIPSMPVV
jgi:hypothetical protein